ncbi:enoyl-CoA hydratase/isomerase family protein [Pseudorhodoplanes sinuspersici]|uniref:Enoyl-CoA hydratase n=1 Tax=Pseudorhodoplanes sinuspersici TaxID=1235591 RepID=A0A1W6ZSQ9_9HYPH|nr:enoyl-CoA hydratase/isomerase family protein [Pseudorhodoplanes sinuspersici]ARP99774.1 enoyl-CoA hydratase [Pseudorhodoplanes sinuspersici]RKE70767.1 short chain enoyl-CoA hydratase [Pseudorhodoplanes sinuspersici]
MPFQNFKVEVADFIAIVTFDRPPVNAQNREAREEAITVFDQLSDRDDVRVVVLTGAGKTFSAGADVKERVGMVQEPGDYLRHNRLTREFFYAVADCTKPVIAAVNGPAIGAGLALMLACDIMLMSDTAYGVMPEVDVGLSGGQSFIMEHLSKSKARWMYFTGAKVPAQEFYRLGIVEQILPTEALLPAALDIARIIAAKSPVAVQAAKRGFNTVAEMPVREGYRYEQSITVALSHSEDAREAQRAFVEKRKPVFTGR